jgi:hypothetical protein
VVVLEVLWSRRNRGREDGARVGDELSELGGRVAGSKSRSGTG